MFFKLLISVLVLETSYGTIVGRTDEVSQSCHHFSIFCVLKIVNLALNFMCRIVRRVRWTH